MEGPATIWWPESNPVGLASLVAVLLGASSIAIVRGLSKSYPRGSAVLEWIAPIAFLSLSAVKEGSPVFHVLWSGFARPDVSDFVAGAIYLALGFGFALANLRKTCLLQRVNGLALTLILGSFIVGEAVSRVTGLVGRSRFYGWYGNALWPSLAVFWVLWPIVATAIWVSTQRQAATKSEAPSFQ